MMWLNLGLIKTCYLMAVTLCGAWIEKGQPSEQWLCMFWWDDWLIPGRSPARMWEHIPEQPPTAWAVLFPVLSEHIEYHQSDCYILTDSSYCGMERTRTSEEQASDLVTSHLSVHHKLTWDFPWRKNYECSDLPLLKCLPRPRYWH